jgi:phage gp45-like
MIDEVNRRLASLFSRGVMSHADVQAGMLMGQAEFYKGETRRVEVPQGYGFASKPAEGAELFAVFANGERSAGVALAHTDRRLYPTDVGDGQVMVYGKGVRDDLGHWLRFTDQPKQWTIVAKAKRLELRAGLKYLFVDADEGIHASEAIQIP